MTSNRSKRIVNDKKQPRKVVAFPWYRAADWARLRELSVDRENIQESYEAWTVYATGALRGLRRQGLRVLKVDISVAQMESWCKTHNRPLDAKARAEFAGLQLPNLK